MKYLGRAITALVVSVVMLTPVTLLGAKKAEPVKKVEVEKKAEASEAKEAPKGKLLYEQNFEEADDEDGWNSDSELAWKKGGAAESKGCIKIGCSAGAASTEKSLEWYDNKTIIEFDYKTDFTEDLYVLARGKNANVNVRTHIKGFATGKWAHAKVKAASLDMHGTSGKGDTFYNLVIVGTGGTEKSVLLLDNIVIRAEGGANKESDD